MPPCGTFDYAGVIPADGMRSWELEDQSEACAVPDDTYEQFKKRLVGLRPTLSVTDGRLVLEAESRERAVSAAASFELDPALLAVCLGGDHLYLSRTATADIGVSLLRGRELVFAVGAVTVMALGDMAELRNGPPWDAASGQWPRSNSGTWIDITVDGSRLRKGDTLQFGAFVVTVIRTFDFEVSIPGEYECVAISRSGACSHDAAVRSAKLLTRYNAGLRMLSTFDVRSLL